MAPFQIQALQLKDASINNPLSQATVTLSEGGRPSAL